MEQVRAIGRDSKVFEATLGAARARTECGEVDAEDLRRALSLWDGVWIVLTPKEQARVLALLVERVAYDGAAASAALSFRPSGIKALSEEVAT